MLERLLSLLFRRRVRGLRSVWDMPAVDRRRVLWSAELLQHDEEQAQAALGLRRRPRLLIFDEEAAVLITAEERDEFTRIEGEPGPPSEDRR